MSESIIAQLLATLRQRESASRTITLAGLAAGLPKSCYLRYAELYLQLPDAGFLRRLIDFDDRHPAVATVLEAWGYGVRLRLMIHRQLLPALPLCSLARLPVTIVDQRETAVHLLAGQCVSYGDVALLHDCWLLVRSQAAMTPLARDVLEKQNIRLIRQE